ncbi:MAG: CoA-binding protein [Desulfobacteraceae bacterium]|nr:MAG: CoA-binding protein [Desulfobacteraceae bacterium]
MVKSRVSSNLRFLFNPTSVAVIGASENHDKLGFHVMKSLTKGKFEGKIVPINPRSTEILGTKSFSSVAEFEEPIDLAVVTVPARLVPGIFEEGIKKNIKGIVLITAGFKEIDDPHGAELQNMLADLVHRAGIPVIGPNTFGIINLHQNLNASFTPEFSWLKKGHVALVSQSGGICHLLSFMAMRQNVGMSKIVGLGNRLNVDFPEMVAFLMEDPDTRVILLYLEGLEEPRSLMKVLRKNWGKKPIIAYKTGSAEVGDRASLSHTGSMAGKQEIYEASLKQAGVLCLANTEILLDLARALAICPLPEGKRVAILSGQAGPSIAASDVCEMAGLQIKPLSPHTQHVINEFLPPLALRTNPVDMGPAWYNPKAIAGIVNAVMEDENVDGILLLMMYASANREVVDGISKLLLELGQRKPLVTSLISPPGIWDEQVTFLENEEALVNFPTPERAARAMAYLWRYKKIKDRIEDE